MSKQEKVLQDKEREEYLRQKGVDPGDFPYAGNSLENRLGITISPTDSDGTIHAEMPVDSRTCQPFGFLSGGASLALAETLAGYGSFDLCAPGEVPCGLQVSGSHMAPVPVGERVCASGVLLHRGRTTHVWDISIRLPDGTLISSVRVTNAIVRHK